MGDVLGAIALGLPAGWLAALLADRIATVRYAEGAPGHDPEDLELAPLAAPSSTVVRGGSALVTAGAFALIVNELGWARWAVPFCLLAFALVVGSLVDLQYLRLPNVVTYGAAGAVLVLIVAVTVSLPLTSSDEVRGIYAAIVGALAYSGALLGFSLLAELVMRRAGLGLGDVKLALSLGATAGWLGWLWHGSDQWALAATRVVVYAALFGSIAGAIGGLALTRLQPKRHFPYGPFLALGWLWTVLVADSLVR